MQGFYLDIEADSFYLYAKKVWYIKARSLDGKREMSVHPFRDVYASEKIMDWVNSFPDGCFVVGHNFLGFDAWVLWKFFGVKPVVGKKGKDYLGGKEVQFIDTYVLSMYLQPDNKFHSLAYLSSGAEVEKMDFRKGLVELGLMTGSEPKGHEFSFYSDLMQTYCDTDVESGIGVFFKLWEKAKHYYKTAWIHPSFRQLQKDFFLYQAQAYSGVKFDISKAQALVKHIEEEMGKIKAEVDPVLPPRGLKTAEEAFYRVPAKPFKKDGSLSATMEKWLEKHNAKIVGDKIVAYGLECELVAGEIIPISLPMEIEDGVELKQYFLENGWVPHDDFWNFKKDPETGKAFRDPVTRGFIKTTPKIQHAGQICPNLDKLEGFIPKKLVKFLSLRNRKGVVEGWLNNPRLALDGRLSAEVSGYTPTFRVRHKTVVNCPKADPKVLLGAEMRDLFTVEKGNFYVGTDAAALENRTVAAYTMKYDGGKFANIVLKGDSHTFNSFAFFPEIASKFNIDEPGLKDKPEFKPYRNKAKTGAYLLAYGGGVAKLASSLNLSKEEAQRSYDNYWLANEGLGKLKKAVEKYYENEGNKQYIPGWDGRLLFARGKNILINLAGQSCGAIAMSYAACLMDAWLGEMFLDDLGRPYYSYKGKKVMRVSLVHDEYSWEVEPGVEEDIRQLTVKAIVRAGELLKLPIALDGEGKIGISWKNVH